MFKNNALFFNFIKFLYKILKNSRDKFIKFHFTLKILNYCIFTVFFNLQKYIESNLVSTMKFLILWKNDKIDDFIVYFRLSFKSSEIYWNLWNWIFLIVNKANIKAFKNSKRFAKASTMEFLTNQCPKVSSLEFLTDRFPKVSTVEFHFLYKY